MPSGRPVVREVSSAHAATGAAVLAANRGTGSFGATRQVTAPWRVQSRWEQHETEDDRRLKL